MKPATRRTLLYCFLLLLPTLAAAGGALWLLHREQLRINEQSQVAAEGRKIAVSDRARLIAENIEILMTDIQSGLMNTLMEAPSDGPASFLKNWKSVNPLVGEVFQATNDGRIRWGNSGAAVSSWMLGAPWSNQNAEDLLVIELSEKPKEKIALPAEISFEKFSAPQAETPVSANVAQYQSQRISAQKISSLNAEAIETKSAVKFKAHRADKVTGRMAESVDDGFQKEKARKDLNGWTPWFDDTQTLHIIGWRLCANGTVLVVDVKMRTLEEQLGQMLPQTIPEHEAYSLVRADGRVVNKVGSLHEKFVYPKTSASENNSIRIIKIPLSTKMLPDWAIRGTFIAGDGSGAAGSTFFTTSALLVFIFVCTILFGGGLFLRQARISEMESLQKTSFVANVSHELKTPLTSIRLHAELLEQNRIRDEERRGHFLSAIGRETQRLTRLVNNVLDFSRLEQGRRKITLSNINLTNELNAILDCHAPRIEDAGLSLTRSFPEKEIFINTDSDALGQIVINLIDNACKYAASGKELNVSLTQADDGGIKIAVADRGLGIPASHRKRIFEKFHRVDNSITAEQGGAGLGLSIAHQLALALGGDLRYENREGGGGRFTLVFRKISLNNISKT